MGCSLHPTPVSEGYIGGRRGKAFSNNHSFFTPTNTEYIDHSLTHPTRPPSKICRLTQKRLPTTTLSPRSLLCLPSLPPLFPIPRLRLNSPLPQRHPLDLPAAPEPAPDPFSRSEAPLPPFHLSPQFSPQPPPHHPTPTHHSTIPSNVTLPLSTLLPLLK